MYRFLLRPRWLVAHTAVLAIAVLFVSLGLWQLRRLDERRADNALISQRLSQPPQALATAVAGAGGDAKALAYRRVWVTGRYDVGDEVLLTPRADRDAPGHHVVTPLRTAAGRAVLVDRGWVPFALDEPPVAQAAPPDGEVRVEGIVLPPATAARAGSSRGDPQRLTFVSAVDAERLQPQVAAPLYPFSLLLESQQPVAPGELPRPPALPQPSEGSHLSYAIQWFSFAAIGVLGYPLLIRKSLRARRDGRAAG